MLTNGQKKALHLAARAAGVDEPARRLIQRNVGGFHSAADRTATRQGYIAVMAFYERACGGQLEGFTKGYWTAEDERANPADALVFRIRREAGTCWAWSRRRRRMPGRCVGTWPG